jgi:hypothetical protein
MRNLTTTKSIPDIVVPVLRTAGRLWHNGALSQEAFADKVARLKREELEPRGLQLIEDMDQNGWPRFAIRQRHDGSMCGLILCADCEESACEESEPLMAAVGV